MISALLFLATVAVSQAHICVFDPPQRGPAVPRDIGPGYKACYVRTEAACLALPPAVSPRKVYTGFPFVVEFQQNLNHWTTENPGFFHAYFQDSNGVNYPAGKGQFSDYPARDMITQANFNMTVTAGKDVPTGHVMLFLAYQSNSAGEIDPPNNTQAVFYQCMDVEVTPLNANKPETSDKAIVESRRVKTVPNTPCVADFGFIGYASTSPGNLYIQVWWDMANNRTRFDTTETDGTIVTRLTDYTTGLEFRYIAANKSCSLFGPDAPYPWGYGAQYGMHTDSIEKEGDSDIIYYSNQFNGMSWTAAMRPDGPSQQSCYPDSVTFFDGNVMTYNAVTATNFPESDTTFIPPDYCHPSNSLVDVHPSCNPINIAKIA